ncbi:MAG TPA: STAS domain-containing protein [Vicinamibacteria bacterium]|nr:STAS domain-containing protein [Vicinamibacteria bacterium]
MEIGESRDGEVTILAPKGSLNTQTSPKLEQRLLAALGEKARLIVIDFRGVDYLSSAALRVLLMVTRRLTRVHGRLLLCGMSEDLKKVFAISGFDRDFTILSNRGEAVAVAAATPPPPPKADADATAARRKTQKKEAPPAEPEPPPPPAPAPAAAPPPLAASVARILASGEDSPPWASWPEATGTGAKLERVAALLAAGL